MQLILDQIIEESCAPAEYQYYKGLKDRRIIFNQDVDQDIVERVMLPLIEMDTDGSGKPITIIINTNGGEIFDGMPLCDIIDNLKTPTTIVCIAHAFSMGGFFLMAGYNNPNVKKVCYKHSTALLHGGQTCISGTAAVAKDTARFQDRYDERIREYVLTHSKITEEEYDRMERYEWYMDSDEMLRTGLVDEVIGA